MILKEGLMKQVKNLGVGKILSLVETNDCFYLNGHRYDKYNLFPIPFEFIHLNQDIPMSSYNDINGYFRSMCINKTADLCHTHKSYSKYTHKLDSYCSSIKDLNDHNIAYILYNKQCDSDNNILYIINVDTNVIINKINLLSQNVVFAGQDNQYIYLYNIGIHTASNCGGFTVYDKVNNTVQSKSHMSTYTSSGVSVNSNYMGFIYFDNNNGSINILQTSALHKDKTTQVDGIQTIQTVIARNGQGLVKNVEVYNNNAATSPDNVIKTDFHKVNFDLKSSTRYSSYSKNQIFVPFFSFRDEDLEEHITQIDEQIIKFLYMTRGNLGWEWYKELPVNINTYIEKHPDFIYNYAHIIKKLYTRQIESNICSFLLI